MVEVGVGVGGRKPKSSIAAKRRRGKEEYAVNGSDDEMALRDISELCMGDMRWGGDGTGGGLTSCLLSNTYLSLYLSTFLCSVMSHSKLSLSLFLLLLFINSQHIITFHCII